MRTPARPLVRDIDKLNGRSSICRERANVFGRALTFSRDMNEFNYYFNGDTDQVAVIFPFGTFAYARKKC